MCAPCWAVCSQKFEIWYIWRIFMIYIEFRPDTCHWSTLDRGLSVQLRPRHVHSRLFIVICPCASRLWIREELCTSETPGLDWIPAASGISNHFNQAFWIKSKSHMGWRRNSALDGRKERHGTVYGGLLSRRRNAFDRTTEEEEKPLQRGLVFFSRSWSSIWIQGQKKNNQNFKNQFWTYPGWGERNLVSHKMALQKPILFFSLFFFLLVPMSVHRSTLKVWRVSRWTLTQWLLLKNVFSIQFLIFCHLICCLGWG